MIDRMKANKELLRDIFGRMRANPELAGAFEKTDAGISWRLFDGYMVGIDAGYIGIDRVFPGGIRYPITHWHPEDEDLYRDICRLGTKGNVTVIHKSILSDGVVYSGPRDQCRYRRKQLFGRYITLYAE